MNIKENRLLILEQIGNFSVNPSAIIRKILKENKNIVDLKNKEQNKDQNEGDDILFKNSVKKEKVII
ncbi:hypothetical protein HOG21_07010 [bacterium]|nr:hypothetical protein [bacterium]